MIVHWNYLEQCFLFTPAVCWYIVCSEGGTLISVSKLHKQYKTLYPDLFALQLNVVLYVCTDCGTTWSNFFCTHKLFVGTYLAVKVGQLFVGIYLAAKVGQLFVGTYLTVKVGQLYVGIYLV